jgi:TolA-binding protein
LRKTDRRHPLSRIALLLTACAACAIFPAWSPAARAGETPEAEGNEEAGADEATVEAFKELSTRVRSGEAVSEADVVRMLTQAKTLGRPFAASQAVKSYLKVNLQPSGKLLRLAAESAELAGDLQNAVIRYKNYLRKASPDAAASDAAARMYRLMVYVLPELRGEAYDFWRGQGKKFRATTDARKYDHFFFNYAVGQGHYKEATDFLVEAANGAKGANKSLYTGHALTLARELLDMRQGHQIERKGPHADLIRAAKDVATTDRQRHYLEVAAAYLDCRWQHYQEKDSLTGTSQRQKSERALALDRMFGPALEAAKEWYDADPRLTTVYDVYLIFSGGKGDHHQWSVLAGHKQRFFRHAWDQFNEEQKRVFMQRQKSPFDYHHLIGNHWHKDMYKHQWLLDLFDSREASYFLNGKDKTDIKAIAGQIGDSGGWLGIMARSIASTQDPIKLVDAIVSEHGAWDDAETWWHLYEKTRLFGAQQKAYGLGQDYDPVAGLEHYWLEYHSKSLSTLTDRAQTRDMLEHLWKHRRSKPEKLAAILSAIKWVPYTGNQRSEIFGRARKDLSRWEQDVTRRLQSLKRKNNPNEREREQLAQYERMAKNVPTIKKLFDELSRTKAHEQNEAPTPATKLIKAIVLANRANQTDQVNKKLRELYAAVKDQTGRLGRRQLFTWMSDLGDWELRTWLLEKTLADLAEKDDYAAVHGTLEGLKDRRGGWPDKIPASEKEIAKTVNEMVTKAFTAELERGNYRKQLLDWVHYTHRSDRWQEYQWGEEAMTSLVEKDWYQTHPDDRPWQEWPASLNYIYLINSHFPTLRAKYLKSDHFDQMIVDDAKKLTFLHEEYGNRHLRGLGTTDKSGKIAEYVVSLWKEDKDPFIRGRDEWYGALLNGGGRKHLLAYYDQELEKGDAVTKAGLGWYDLNHDAFAQDASPEERKPYFDAMRAYIEAANRYQKVWPAPTFSPLQHVDPASLTDEELDTLLLAFRNHMELDGNRRDHRNHYSYYNAPEILHQGLREKNRAPDLFAAIPHMWSIARELRHGGYQRKLRSTLGDYIGQLMEAQASELAASYATAGLQCGGELSTAQTKSLESTRSKLVSLMGTIPVPPSDPSYKLFKAQLNFRGGSVESAWTMYHNSKDLITSTYKDLDIDFLTWLVERHNRVAEFDDATALSRLLIRWVDKRPEIFSDEQRGRLFMAFADIAYGKKEYPVARAKYESIKEDSSLRGTSVPERAELRVAEIDRVTKNFDKAIQALEGLRRTDNEELKVEALYQLALCQYDQKQYKEADETLERVVTLKPSHVDAKVKHAEVQIKLKNLESPTEVSFNMAEAQRIIVPGQPLRVKLKDPTLSRVGSSSNIEVMAWTEDDNGEVLDREFLTLRPFADSRIDFRGELSTKLGTAKEDDRLLQLLGEDMVYYDFSPAFKRNNKIDSDAKMALRVRTDAELRASSGKIYSEEEIEEVRLREMLTKRTGGLDVERRISEIKPGNDINLRVTDPDMSFTDRRDRLSINAESTSGDKITALELEETGPASGVFEGRIVTTKAPAVAFASDNGERSEPGFAISHKEYPAWTGAPDGEKPKWFSVDLNDNVALQKLSVLAQKPGQGLKDFLVQVGFNRESFTTVGRWPKEYTAWDGKLQLEVVPGSRSEAERRQRQQEEEENTIDRSYIDWGYIVAEKQKKTLPQSDFSFSLAPDDFRQGEFKDLGIRPDGTYFARLRGAFYIAEGQARIFTPQYSIEDGTKVQLLLDGEEVFSKGLEEGRRRRREPEEDENDEFKALLLKGVHVFELVVEGKPTQSMNFDLLINTDTEPYVGQMPTDLFDQQKYPEIATAYADAGATITASEDNTRFDVEFAGETNSRLIRLLCLDFEGQAPAINKLHLTDRDGEKVLPSKHDFRDLRQNKTLEIVAGDKVNIRYTDDRPLKGEGKKVYEAFMEVVYNDAELEASFIEYIQKKDIQVATYIPLVRFKREEPVVVFINDPDADVSGERDKIPFEVTVTERDPVTMEAMETESQSGVFTARVFPSAKKGERPNDLKLGPNDNITLTYLDKENVEPGVPWEREKQVVQVLWFDPEMRICNSEVMPLLDLMETDADLAGDLRSIRLSEDEESLAAKRAILVRRPEIPNVQRQEISKADEDASTRDATAPDGMESAGPMDPDGGEPVARNAEGSDQPAEPTGTQNDGQRATAYIGAPVPVQIIWPTAVLSPESKISIYAQTSAGREAYDKALNGPFDINVPGTIKLTGTPSAGNLSYGPPEGITAVRYFGKVPGDELQEGIFTFMVPTHLGDVPDQTLATEEALARQAMSESNRYEEDEGPSLAVNGQDTVHIGFKYEDWNGNEYWLTKEVDLIGSAVLAATDDKYEEPLEGIHVGETVYLKLIDNRLDTSNARDRVTVTLESSVGETELELRETFEHTGEFRGMLTPVYAEKGKEAPAGELPVQYGDEIVAYFKDKTGTPLEARVKVHKGSDGVVAGFTKRFNDEDMGVRTQFMIAEAYFELAKKHRRLGHEDISRREIMQGKRLLEEAQRDMPGSKFEAQAKYLLAELELEFAKDAVNADIKKRHLEDALARFNDIVASNRDSSYAPKAQYKKGLTYEKMGLLDNACEEFVKLSYRYPDNELVAETIARLGKYFWKMGMAAKNHQKKLNHQEKVDPVELHKVAERKKAMFRTAGEVFARLPARFPSHKLAGKTAVLSGQALILAGDYMTAAEVLNDAIEKYKDQPKLRSEAMYWCADAYHKANAMIDAYRTYKRLDWEHPTTKWAAHARGQLASPAFQKIASDQ